MSYKDLYTVTSPVQMIAPSDQAASQDSTAVDRKFNQSAIVLLAVGTWTDGTHEFELQESDDDVTYTAVDAQHVQGALPVIEDASTDDQSFHIGYLGNARYIRLSVTVSGATTGAVYGATAIQDYPRYAGKSLVNPQ